MIVLAYTIRPEFKVTVGQGWTCCEGELYGFKLLILNGTRNGRPFCWVVTMIEVELAGHLISTIQRDIGILDISRGR